MKRSGGPAGGIALMRMTAVVRRSGVAVGAPICRWVFKRFERAQKGASASAAMRGATSTNMRAKPAAQQSNEETT